MEQLGFLEKIILLLLNLSLLVIYCSIIFWVSDQSTFPTAKIFEHQDKLLHVLAYFIMGILAWRTAYSITHCQPIVALVTLIFCSVYGWSDEWHQSFVPGRTSSIADWLADMLGAVLSITLLWSVYTQRQKTHRLDKSAPDPKKLINQHDRSE